MTRPEGWATGSVGIEVQDVSHSFVTSRNGRVVALENVSLSLRPHEFVCLVGPSGCGKSTLLRIIAGLIDPSQGTVQFSDHAARPRGVAAMVFQEHGLFPWLSVLDNVAFGLEVQGVPPHARREQAMAFVRRAGLAAFAADYPHELSVGMRQRVGIARAFLSGAPVLLMDEPFGSLDAQTKWVLQEDLLHIWQSDRKLVLFVTHDIEEAVLLGDRVVVMTGRPGRIAEEIPIPFERPRNLARGQERVREITWHVWHVLEDDVRRQLAVDA